jgi:hypothetical protein
VSAFARSSREISASIASTSFSSASRRDRLRRHTLVGRVLVVQLVRFLGLGVALRAELLELRHVQIASW